MMKQVWTNAQHYINLAIPLKEGTRAVTDQLLVTFSTIAAMCIDGIIDLHITSGSVDGETFARFFERCLLPNLLPYNGTNPRIVVI